MEQLKSGPKEPLMMPGPKFGDDNGWWAKIKKDRQKVTLVIIALLIIAGGIFLYSDYQRSSQINTEEEQSSQQEEGVVKPEQVKIGQPQTTTTSSTQIADVTSASSGKVIVKANKGAGVTHLARMALKDYLERNPDLKQKITPEHKIYIEDYIKDQTGSFPLKIGQEISFDENLIKEAIDSSLKMTENQLKNLHKYVLLVPSLAG